MRPLERLLGELAHWKRALFEAPLVGLLLLALAGGIAAYQVRRPYRLEVGGIHDAPYLIAFHEPEPDRRKVPQPEVDFRWTRERVDLHLLGVGHQPLELCLRLQAYRPAGVPPRITLLTGDGPLLSTTVGGDWAVYRVLLPPPALTGGDLRLAIFSETFQPPGDPRELGVAVDWVEVRPAGVGWIGPAWGQVGALLGCALLTYLLLHRWGVGRAWSSGLTALGILLLATLLAWHRLSLTYFTPTLVLLLFWGCLLTALFLPLLENRSLAGWTHREARLLWAVLLTGFLLRLGGMCYPQFRSSDLLFHAHRAAWVGSGTLLFTADLPDVNIPAPYPPGLYITLLPGTLLLPDMPVLLEIAGTTLDALCGLGLYLLARQLSRRPRAALFALLLQQAAPVTYLIYSWGNFSNLFSRAALLGVLILLCLGPGLGRPARRAWWLLAGACLLVLLGHFADSLLLVGLVLGTAGLAALDRQRKSDPFFVLSAFLLAAGVALALYYTAPPIQEVLAGGWRTFVQGQGGPTLRWSNPLPQVVSFLQAPLLLLALAGAPYLLTMRRGLRRPTAVLGSALLTALVFFLGQAAVGFSTRYTLFLLPVLAAGAGAVLAAWWRKGPAGRLATAILLLSLLGQALVGWHTLIAFGQR